jgi:hypothetical protein
MESRTRNVWIIVLLVLVAFCCCAVAALAAGFGWITNWSFDVDQMADWDLARVTDQTVQTFEVDASPTLEMDSFAGNITVRAGAEGTIQVTATRHARRASDLDEIEVDFDESGDGLSITTRLRRRSLSNTYVEFDIAVPAGTDLALKLGAGNVVIDDVQGDIEVRNGAGEIDIRGARGVARVELGAGGIDYEGEPQGECRFQTGAGAITLRLPGDLNAEIDLDTGIGEVDVSGFDVDGQVSRGKAQGTIGRGGGTSIYAHTAAGSVELRRR